MAFEIVTIGTELLLGFTLDSNAAEAGRALAGIGLPVTRRTTIGDDPGAIATAVTDALRRTGRVLCTGGLGPTADDVTKKVVAGLYQAELEFRPEIWDHLVARFRRFGRVPPERNRSQAEVPRGATVLPNRWGTAPGLWLEGPPGLVILLPGVPHEMRGLLHAEVLPRLVPRSPGLVVRSRTVRTTGIAESALADLLDGMEPMIAPLSLAYLPGPMGVDLRLTAWSLPPDEAARRLEQALHQVVHRAGDRVYGRDEEDLAALVLALARGRGLRLAVAESCTGGGLGARITAVPGSSDVFLGGIIAYDNRVKLGHLAVAPELLERHGAVSAEVAQAMALGVSAALEADLGIAVTGIAGPGGGTPEKPVGLVYVATAVSGVAESHRLMFPGDRDEIRERAAQAGLFALFRRLGDPARAAPGS